jgi:hypothetical protein
MDFKHPLIVTSVGAVLTALIGGIGWLSGQAITTWRSSDLRVAIEHPVQFVRLDSATQPKIKDVTVFCDTVKFVLTLAHNHEGQLASRANKNDANRRFYAVPG